MSSDVLHTPFQPPTATVTNGHHPAIDEDPPPAIVRTITPEMAAEFMGRNHKNRPIRDDEVNKYARDMTAGVWIVNAETVKVARNDDVLDGQHRLLACMRAGVPFRTYIATGLPSEAQDTIDCGITRKDSDQLGLHGEYQPKSLAAITKWAIRWAAGTRGRRSGSGGIIKPSHSEVIGFIRINPEIRDATRWAVNARGRYKSVRVSVYGMAWWLFTHIDSGVYGELARHQAEDFLEKVVTGADVGIGHPAYTLRERFRRSWEMDERLNEAEQLALFITAWNGWRDGKEMRRIPLPSGGVTPKNFPEPH